MFGRTEAPAQTPRVSQLEARVVLLELPRIPKLTVTTVSVVRHDVALEQAAAALSSAYVELPDHVAHVAGVLLVELAAYVEPIRARTRVHMENFMLCWFVSTQTCLFKANELPELEPVIC